jgi:membrane protease YdiL (CAAX protease family)
MENPNSLTIGRHGLTRTYKIPAYFVLAFIITWLGALTYSFTLPKNGQLLPAFLNFPGAVIWYYGPFTAALIVTRFTGGKGSIRKLLKRFLVWRVGWVWYAFILLYPLLLHLIVVGLDWLLAGSVPVFFQAEGVASGNIWLTLMMLVLFNALIRGIGEETGWRGFALPHLQSRMSALTASLVLGVLWALWHFNPANFPALLSTSGVFIFLNITFTTVIYTWVYNHTKGSLLIAALFHMTLNVTEYVVPIGIIHAGFTRNILQILVILFVAIMLLLVSGPQLGKEGGSTSKSRTGFPQSLQ